MTSSNTKKDFRATIKKHINTTQIKSTRPSPRLTVRWYPRSKQHRTHSRRTKAPGAFTPHSNHLGIYYDWLNLDNKRRIEAMWLVALGKMTLLQSFCDFVRLMEASGARRKILRGKQRKTKTEHVSRTTLDFDGGGRNYLSHISNHWADVIPSHIKQPRVENI